MTNQGLLKVLDRLDAQGRWAFTFEQLRLLFPAETLGSFRKSLCLRAKEDIVLRQVCRGLYVNRRARSMPANTLVALVPYIRPWAMNYLSLETVLGGTDDLSQLPGRLVVASEGRSAVIETPYGTIEFVRTRLTGPKLMKGLSLDISTGVYVADRDRALADYTRHRRARDLLQMAA